MSGIRCCRSGKRSMGIYAHFIRIFPGPIQIEGALIQCNGSEFAFEAVIGTVNHADRILRFEARQFDMCDVDLMTVFRSARRERKSLHRRRLISCFAGCQSTARAFSLLLENI